MNHLVEIRKNMVTDRVRENQDKTSVDDKGRELLTIRRRGNRVILSGENVRLRKVQNADPVIINYLRSLFLEAEDETELKFETDGKSSLVHHLWCITSGALPLVHLAPLVHQL